MRHATYTGPLEHLRGATALVQDQPNGLVLAQFDNRRLTRDGKPWAKVLEYEPHARFPTFTDPDRPPSDALGFGWHEFQADQFTTTTP